MLAVVLIVSAPSVLWIWTPNHEGILSAIGVAFFLQGGICIGTLSHLARRDLPLRVRRWLAWSLVLALAMALVGVAARFGLATVRESIGMLAAVAPGLYPLMLEISDPLMVVALAIIFVRRWRGGFPAARPGFKGRV